LQGTLPQAQKSGADTQHRVLLVDDDAVSLQVLSLMLGFEGHEVLQASDGESALAILAHPDSTTAPDVLLVDMQMPGISGRELVQKIRAMEGPKPLLLGMSATALKTEQMRGFDGFLLKPLDLDDLRVALKPARTGNGAHRKILRNGFSVESPVKPGGALGKLITTISEPHRKLSAKETATGAARRTSTQAPTPRAGQAPKEQSINPAVLNNLRKAMPLESLKELYTVCLTDSRDRAIALQALAGEGRLAEIPRGAHQIKGAASMVGANRIARLATALELGSCKKEDTMLLLNDLLDACNQLEHILLAGKLDDSDN
jgi:CheY-like chemotaxis protein